MTRKKTLVLGGTGKTGRRVAERLWNRGVPVRIGSRSSDPPFDWEDPHTWAPVLAGVDAAYISYYPDLAVSGAAPAIQAFTDLAVAAGVRRLVMLSGRGEPAAQQCERLVQDSGADWTVVRASWFAQNFSEGYFLAPLQRGALALPAGEVGEPFVDADDIAEVAAAALTDTRHAQQVYEVTGPRLWTFRQAIAEIAIVTGRDIRFTYLNVPEYVTALEKARVPAELVTLARYLFAEVLDGRNASVHDGVRRALGRRARDFSAYVRETAATGVWARMEAAV